MFSLETLFTPASKAEAVPGSSSGIPLAILSLSYKWKDPDFFVFSTSSQKMIVHLADGTANCLEGY